jgi:hypothetical protein
MKSLNTFQIFVGALAEHLAKNHVSEYGSKPEVIYENGPPGELRRVAYIQYGPIPTPALQMKGEPEINTEKIEQKYFDQAVMKFFTGE